MVMGAGSGGARGPPVFWTGGAQGGTKKWYRSTCRSLNHADLRTICDIMNSRAVKRS